MKAAGILALCSETGRFLLMQRSPRQDNPLTWATYGGGVEGSETPTQAARREFWEETGYPNPSDIKLYVLPEYNLPEKDFTFYNYLGIVPKEFEPKDCWETFDYGWFDYGDWPSPLHPGVKWLFDNDEVMNKIEQLINQGG
jgi:8-oxo-dGTP pyrophosphatase MutT (NUDIX family)